MARQSGPIRFEGRLGDLCFYKDKNGNHIVRQAGGPSREKVKYDHIFRNFRRTGTEFGSVSGSCKIIRHAFTERYCKEGTTCNRLTSLGRQIMISDRVHPLGERRMVHGNLQMLEGFEWNSKLSMEQALKTDYAGFIDPDTGKMHLVVNSFKPHHNIKAPKGATHFSIQAKGATLDLEGKHFTRTVAETAPIRISRKETGTILLDLDTEQNDHPILALGMGVRFYEEVDGELLSLHEGAFTIIKACRRKIAEPAATKEISETASNPDRTSQRSSRTLHVINPENHATPEPDDETRVQEEEKQIE